MNNVFTDLARRETEVMDSWSCSGENAGYPAQDKVTESAAKILCHPSI